MQLKILLKIASLLAFILYSLTVNAQHAAFITHGKIEYERSVNAYAILEKFFNASQDVNGDMGRQIMDNYKKNYPQFDLTQYTLSFTNNKSLYEPNKVDKKTGGFMDVNMLIGTNTVYFNAKNQQTVAQKNFFETDYLITDSTRKFIWKITDEYRDIAGFNCRRANGLMLDSVYVVAFYTDQIIPSFGPESFNGLPGMILGVAVPHENITWFAKKVYAENISDDKLAAPSKGKKYTFQEAVKNLRDVTKQFNMGENFIVNKFIL